MRILHLVHSCIPGEFRGGVSKVVFDLGRAQVQLGHAVSIYTTNYNSTVPANVPAGGAVEADGVDIRYFHVDEPRWFRSDSLRQALLREVRTYDILHGHNTFLALNRYAAEAHDRSGQPLFFHVHGALDPVVVNQGLVKSLRKHIYISTVERRVLDDADGIFALSENEELQIRHYGVHAPILIVPNGVWPDDPDESQGAQEFRARLGIRPEQQVILFLGRIVAKKGLHLLLQAFNNLRTRLPQVVLVLVGDRDQAPDYVRHLDAIVAEGAAEREVLWAGFLNESEKRHAWAAATVFCHPSESEGMAVSILEAMSAGVPTIVSRECNMEPAAQAGAVIEVERTVDSLGMGLARLLNDPGLCRQVGQAGRAYIQNHHAWPVLAGQIVQAYRDVLRAY
jgi:glycosyltransferase involved in cell wall biosynthesis